jgi:hypothetical protein
MSALPAFVPASVDSLYASPRKGPKLEDCWFYHTIDLPGHDTIHGAWDLRTGVEEYLGHVCFAGKRVLEMGTASGMLCFAMEKRGAEVVAFDLAPDAAWDLVPHAAHPDLSAALAFKAQELERLRNSYWYSHRVLGSRARVVYGSVYAVPAAIGPVDVSTFGSILLHLRDPFLALANAARLTRETVVVTDLAPAPTAFARPPWWRRLFHRSRSLRPACLSFLPSPDQPDQVDTWWRLTPEIVERFLQVLGFERCQVSHHTQPYQGQPHDLFTVVAQRTRPAPRRIDGPFPWC